MSLFVSTHVHFFFFSRVFWIPAQQRARRPSIVLASTPGIIWCPALCVCVCVYICLCVHVCVCICVLHMCMYVYVCVCMCMYVYVCVYVCDVPPCAYLCVCACVCMGIRVRARAHICVHVWFLALRIYVYVCVRPCVFVDTCVFMCGCLRVHRAHLRGIFLYICAHKYARNTRKHKFVDAYSLAALLMRMCTYTHIDACVHTYTDTNTHTDVPTVIPRWYQIYKFEYEHMHTRLIHMCTYL